MIEYSCPMCSEKMSSPVSMAGQTDYCPVCGESVKVPMPEVKIPPPATPTHVSAASIKAKRLKLVWANLIAILVLGVIMNRPWANRSCSPNADTTTERTVSSEYNQDKAPSYSREYDSTYETYDHGLSEAQRRRIFMEIVLADDIAWEIVEAEFPINPYQTTKVIQEQALKQGYCQEILRLRYLAQIAKKYDLTKEQLNAISVEGVEKQWPMP